MNTPELDALVEGVRGRVVPPHLVMRAVLAMGVAMGVDTVRLCSLNATSEELEHIRSAVARYRRCSGDELVAANRTFWSAIMNGCGNIAYRLAFNTLVAGLDALEDKTLVLANQITARNSDAAATTADELLSRSLTAHDHV